MSGAVLGGVCVEREQNMFAIKGGSKEVVLVSPYIQWTIIDYVVTMLDNCFAQWIKVWVPHWGSVAPWHEG